MSEADDVWWQVGIRTALVIIVVRTVGMSVKSALPREAFGFTWTLRIVAVVLAR